MTVGKAKSDDYVRFSCTACGKRLKTDQSNVGKMIRCKCGSQQLVPWPVMWYFEDQGRQTGPVAESELRELIERGQIVRGTLLRRADASAWLPVDSLFDMPAEGVRPDQTMFVAPEESGSQADESASAAVRSPPPRLQRRSGASKPGKLTRFFLATSGAILFLSGLAVFLAAKSAVHEIEAFLLLLMSLVCSVTRHLSSMVGDLIVELRHHRDND